MNCLPRIIVPAAAAAALMFLFPCVGAQDTGGSASPAATGFHLPAAWELSAPLIAPEKREQDSSIAVKDPSFVFSDGKWHVFMTIKCQGYTPMEYASFDKWENANAAPRHVLKVSDSKYYCAPQVFYFRPHKKWYMIYQVGVPGAKKMWIAYSTTENIAAPNSWTKARNALEAKDPRPEGGLDYWVICDEERAYLFWTTNNGKMWRMWTPLKDFPNGFDHCELALQGDIFEASHTYRLKGLSQYLTIIEANPGGKRYYKAFVADRLDGKWAPLTDQEGKPLANSEQKPFAGAANVRPAAGAALWADNISHGELIRDGVDETMTVDPANLRFIIQGVLQKEKTGGYGQIPWRLGMLAAAN
ncbi:MAG: non-reducing end alpha-L-arabinofuranosidase family hydrolase [Candidatus Sumerlaeota bacterium]|nr:non-reducing end alpha-L-arabinofuranosidase family hydrolase [Candidatus Sumerlaeota bacterium]